jgi:hypothetical protein
MTPMQFVVLYAPPTNAETVTIGPFTLAPGERSHPYPLVASLDLPERPSTS